MSRWWSGGAVIFCCLALVSHLLEFSIPTFVLSAIALIGLSKILSDATEQLSLHVGQHTAGFVNVTLSNLAELIIIFVAVRSNMIGLVQGGIVGSIIGNLLLVMGASIYLGCRKHEILRFNIHTADLFINQFFMIAVMLFLPTMSEEYIPEENRQLLTNVFAVMLAGLYVYFCIASATNKRFEPIEEQAKVHNLEKKMSLIYALTVLVLSAVGAFFMSELLVGEVNSVTLHLGISPALIGFIVLPLLGNIAEHISAVLVAMKGMAELSLSIAVGSASQVGMIVAPCAVLFGFLTGNPVLFDFGVFSLSLLVITFIGAFRVLHNGEWTTDEVIMLVALYLAIVIIFIVIKSFGNF